jgi:hypothetical protein
VWPTLPDAGQIQSEVVRKTHFGGFEENTGEEEVPSFCHFPLLIFALLTADN